MTTDRQSALPQSRRWRAAAIIGYTWMGVFATALPLISVWTDRENREAWRFTLHTYLDLLLLVTLVAAACALLLGVLHESTRGIWRAGWHLVVAISMGLVLTALIGLAAMRFEASLVPYQANMRWLAVAATGLFLVTPLRRHGARLLAGAARLMSPLPLVLLVWFAAVRQPDCRLDPVPESAPGAEATAGGPVYFFMFDALDRTTVIENEQALARFPNLRQCVHDYTWFSDSVSPHHKTRHTTPSVLFQRPELATLNDSGQWHFAGLRDGTLLSDLPSIFDMLRQPGDICIACGTHVEYTEMLRGRDVYIREHPLWYPSHDPLADRLPVMSFHASSYAYWPMARRVFGDSDGVVAMSQDLHSSAIRTIRQNGSNVVGFFHFLWPHPPFVYGPDGLLPADSIAGRDPSDAYLSNMAYADARLGELLQALRETEVYDQSTIVIFGDHGYPYDRQPPLIVKLPFQSAGRSITDRIGAHQIVNWLHRQPEFTRLRPPRE